MNALSLSKLSFNYGSRKALNDISLSISAGETVILLGPNGAGKSTLFSLVCGLFSTSTGSVNINGVDVSKDAAALANLGIVFQSQTLDVDLSVKQNLKYFCALHGMSKTEASKRIEQVLEQFDLHDRANDKIRALNGGHRRRVEIARAILHEPDILLLDEPTVGLDIPTRTALIEHLHSLPEKSNCALLWATHLVDEVAPTDRVVILHKGSIRADGPCDELLRQYIVDDPALILKNIMDSDP